MDQNYFDRNANLKFSQNSNWTKLQFSLQQIQFPVGNKIFEALSFAFLFRILSQWRDQGTFIIRRVLAITEVSFGHNYRDLKNG